MNSNDNKGPRARWIFFMADERPGPSTGDAAELIEGMGFNPWSFAGIEILAESYEAKLVTTAFAVIGALEELEHLRNAYDRTMRTRTAPPRLLPDA